MSIHTAPLLVEEVVARYATIPASEPHPIARVLGRVQVIRHHGRMCFLDLFQGGVRLQLAFRTNILPLPDPLPIGAWLEVEGQVYPSRAGELTLWVEHAQVVQCPTRPVETHPEHGRVPPEQRFVVEPAQIDQARRRTRLLRALREGLWAQGFEEMETPILHRSASGAAARPFLTHSRALDSALALRVAPEPHLIRLLAAGFPRVFEIARAFRNEGVSARHQPEFTLMEVYEASATLDRSIGHCTQLITQALQGAGVDPAAVPCRGHLLDFTRPRVVSLRGIVEDFTGCDSVEACQAWLTSGFHPVPDEPLEAWCAVFEHGVEQHLIQPTFVCDYPASISPLAASVDGQWATRFELFASGMELANGFEQNRDEAVQRERFAAQARRAGEDDVMQADEEYLFAMGWGLPPLSGFGIGIDRLVMLALGVPSIREAVLFPM